MFQCEEPWCVETTRTSTPWNMFRFSWFFRSPPMIINKVHMKVSYKIGLPLVIILILEKDFPWQINHPAVGISPWLWKPSNVIIYNHLDTYWPRLTIIIHHQSLLIQLNKPPTKSQPLCCAQLASSHPPGAAAAASSSDSGAVSWVVEGRDQSESATKAGNLGLEQLGKGQKP